MVNCNNLEQIEKQINEQKAIVAIEGSTYKTFKGIFQDTDQTGFAEGIKANGSWSFPSLDALNNSLETWARAIKLYRDLQNPLTPFIQQYADERIGLASVMQGVISEFKPKAIAYLNQNTNPALVATAGGGVVALGAIVGTAGAMTAPVVSAAGVVTTVATSAVWVTPLGAVIAGIGLTLIVLPAITGSGQKVAFYDGRIGDMMLSSQRKLYDAQKQLRKLTKQRDELLANCTFTGICPSKSDELQIQYFDPSTITTSANKLGRKAVPNDLVDDPRIVAKETEITQKLKDIITLQEEKSKLLAFIQSVTSALDSLQLTRNEILACDGTVEGVLDKAGVTTENTSVKQYNKGISNMTAYCAMKKYAEKAAAAISSIRSIKTDHFKKTELKNKADNIKNAANKIANDIFTHSRQIESISDPAIRFDCITNADVLGKKCLIYRILPGGQKKTVALPQGWANFYVALIGAANNLANGDLFPVTSIPDTHNTFKQKTLTLLDDLKPGNLDTKIATLQSEINDLDIEIEDYTAQNIDAWKQYLRNEVKAYFGSGNARIVGKWFVTAPSTKAIKNKGGSPFQSKSGIFTGAKSNRVYYDLNPDTFILTVRIDNSHIDRALSELSTSTDLDIIEQSMVNVDNINTIEGFTKAGAGYKIKGSVYSSSIGNKIPDTLKRILGDAINPLDVDVDLSSCFRSA